MAQDNLLDPSLTTTAATGSGWSPSQGLLAQPTLAASPAQATVSEALPGLADASTRQLDTNELTSTNINKIMQEKEGGGQFIQAPCGLCGALKEMKDLRRVAGLSVCIDKCAKEMECMT